MINLAPMLNIKNAFGVIISLVMLGFPSTFLTETNFKFSIITVISSKEFIHVDLHTNLEHLDTSVRDACLNFIKPKKKQMCIVSKSICEFYHITKINKCTL